MPRLLQSLFLASALFYSSVASPCDCFSPEMKAKTARDTLDLARLAAVGSVNEIRSDGSALFTVIEGFKGTQKGQIILIEAGDQMCAPKRPTANALILLLAFDSSTTACGVYEHDNFLVREFKILVSK